MSRHIATATRSILLLSSLALCQLAFAQSKTVEVTDCRPVGKAVQMLEEIYKFPITYEDPITVHASQLEDEVQRTPDNKEVIQQYQRDVTLSFDYKLPSSAQSPAGGLKQTQAETEASVADALSSVLDGYAAAGGPVTFTVREDDGVFHVVPINFLNKEGKLQQMTPILDTKITILPKQRTRIRLFMDICQALTKATGISVDEGIFPFNGSRADTITSISGSDVTARSLLSQLLTEWAAPVTSDTFVQVGNGQIVPYHIVDKGGAMSWQLFYGPGFGYALNIHKVSTADQ
jgi:hypothetical protein